MPLTFSWQPMPMVVLCGQNVAKKVVAWEK